MMNTSEKTMTITVEQNANNGMMHFLFGEVPFFL